MAVNAARLFRRAGFQWAIRAEQILAEGDVRRRDAERELAEVSRYNLPTNSTRTGFNASVLPGGTMLRSAVPLMFTSSGGGSLMNVRFASVNRSGGMPEADLSVSTIVPCVTTNIGSGLSAGLGLARPSKVQRPSARRSSSSVAPSSSILRMTMRPPLSSSLS